MSRQLDVKLAEALGYEVLKREELIGGYRGGHVATIVLVMTSEAGQNSILPDYSTDGNAMLELDREMQKRGLSLRTWSAYGDCDAIYSGAVWSKSATMPEAVALAAYKALTGEEWKE